MLDPELNGRQDTFPEHYRFPGKSIPEPITTECLTEYGILRNWLKNLEEWVLMKILVLLFMGMLTRAGVEKVGTAGFSHGLVTRVLFAFWLVAFNPGEATII